MEVGEAAAAAAGEGAFGCSHWFLSLLSLSRHSTSSPGSLFSLHFTLHTHECAHASARTHVKVWSDYTKEGGKERGKMSISFLRRTAAGGAAGSLSIHANPTHTPPPTKTPQTVVNLQRAARQNNRPTFMMHP